MKDGGTEHVLLILETQKVKSWLFASPILRETRGASVLLDLLNRKEIRRVLRTKEIYHDIIYLGGGSGRILFNSKEDAETARKAIEELYASRAADARIALSMQTGETFAAAASKGLDESRQRKQGGFFAHSRIAGRWLRPCTSCGSRPAEEECNEFGVHLLCRSCLQKREAANGLYKAVAAKPGLRSQRPRPLKTAADLKKQYMQDFIFTTLAQKYEEQHSTPLYLPQTTDDIGAASRPENYIGFIYADGDRMGKTVQAISRQHATDEVIKAAQKAFSEITDKATREAAVEAVLRHLPPDWAPFDQDGKFLPAEFLMAGGDDLMLMVPAHAALDIALLFMELFQLKTCCLQQEYCRKGKLARPFAEQGLTSSAGIVLAHAHYPASELMELAADLMKNAKKKSAKLAEQGITTGVLDFMVLAESSTEPVSVRRKKEYQHPKSLISGGTIQRTERPYTVQECRELLNLIRESKQCELPNNKLKDLYAALFKNPYSAQFEALHIRQRLKDTGNLLDEDSPLRRLFFEKLNRFPFRENATGNWSSPLSEFVELYDFIPAKEAA